MNMDTDTEGHHYEIPTSFSGEINEDYHEIDASSQFTAFGESTNTHNELSNESTRPVTPSQSEPFPLPRSVPVGERRNHHDKARHRAVLVAVVAGGVMGLLTATVIFLAVWFAQPASFNSNLQQLYSGVGTTTYASTSTDPAGHVCDVADPCQNQGLCIPSGPDGYFCDCPGLWWGNHCDICGGQPKVISVDIVGPENNRTMLLPIITENCKRGAEAPQYLVLMRRQDGSVNFYRRWSEYKQGFGDLNGEFWIGNENMYYLTNNGTNYGLRVDLKKFSGEHGFAEYRQFSLGPETDKYRLNLGKYRGGTAGDSLSYANALNFSTSDQDNDLAPLECAVNFHGAFWYKGCFSAHLTGPYSWTPNTTYAQGVIWNRFGGSYESLASADMKLYIY